VGVTADTNTLISGRPIIFGEVLFDCFPDGQSVLGGAPFNVAWHMQGFGQAPLMVSSVGSDAHGDKVRATMAEWQMDVSALQVSGICPTGQVSVQLHDGQPSYDIVTDQAYDHINTQAALAAIDGQNPALLYHGSLALRETDSRACLDELLAVINAPVFLDLNLREPWWELPLVETILQRATWVKLNDEELCEVTQHAMGDGLGFQAALQSYAKELFDACDLQWLIVTLGAQGAFVVSNGGIVQGQPVPAENIIDTVGAGDAFSAVTIAGLLRGWSIQDTLDRALGFASSICQQRGATAQNLNLYK
jgi:fructokinase